MPPEHCRPGRVCSPDDSRMGVLTVRRRRLTARGVQPVGSVPHIFEWCDVYGAVAPTTGARVFLQLPSRNAETCQLFIDAVAQALPDSLHLLLLDHSGAHTARHLSWPENVRGVGGPPYGPELNPMARVWRDLKDQRAWQIFPALDTLQDAVGDLLRAYESSTLQSLTGYPYLGEAIHALCL
jgi:hypothetical protein